MKTQTSTYLTRRTPATSAPVSPVPGHPCRVGHSPFGCFAHHSEDGWCVCEEQTGLTVGRGCTEAAAKAAARAYFSKSAEEFDLLRRKCLAYCPPLNPPREKSELSRK